MSDDIRENLWANCALWAYAEIMAETGKSPPDSELTRRRAYRIYEHEIRRKAD